MSATRELIARLRRQLGEDEPLAPARPALPLTPPPRRVFPAQRAQTDYLREASQHTTALVGIGHVGTRYATDIVLQFQAELAVAHEAVASLLPSAWRREQGLLPLNSQVVDHEQYLMRPDLGRRLDEESRQLLMGAALKDVDVQPILADGLSAKACVESGMSVLSALGSHCTGHGLTLGTPMCARFARVWLEDEIGELVRAKVAIIILGERPGLGTGDGLSAYLVHRPTVGKTDGDRNMISNIHRRGLSPEAAGARLAQMASAMIEQNSSGVELDLSRIGAEMNSHALRKPELRESLVESFR